MVEIFFLLFLLLGMLVKLCSKLPNCLFLLAFASIVYEIVSFWGNTYSQCVLPNLQNIFLQFFGIFLTVPNQFMSMERRILRDWYTNSQTIKYEHDWTNKRDFNFIWAVFLISIAYQTIANRCRLDLVQLCPDRDRSPKSNSILSTKFNRQLLSKTLIGDWKQKLAHNFYIKDDCWHVLFFKLIWQSPCEIWPQFGE